MTMMMSMFVLSEVMCQRHWEMYNVLSLFFSLRCVIKEKGCGCNHDDRYYLPGETFWADSLCKQRCVCDAGTQKVKCKQAGCRKGEKCSVVDGVQGCVPVGFKTCSAHGDPHYTSFDGRRFDFQGNCVYKLASVCGDQSGLEPFEVSS